MNDQDVIQHAADVLQTRVYGPYGPYLINRQPNYRVLLHGRSAMVWMRKLYPLLGMRRRAQIDKVLQKCL